MITQLIAGPFGGGFLARLRGVASSGPCEIVVRLDSAQANADTLVALREASVALSRSGGRLVVVAGDPYARRLLAMTGLDRTLDVRSHAGSRAHPSCAPAGTSGRPTGTCRPGRGTPPPDTLESA